MKPINAILLTAILSACSSGKGPPPIIPVIPPLVPVPPAPVIPTNTILFSCDFEDTLCGMEEQCKTCPQERRLSFVTPAISGNRSLRLHTEAGDSSVNGSGEWERNDLQLGPNPFYCNPGRTEWWSFSVLFPDDYVFPPGPGAGILMDFHHNSSSGLPNYGIETVPGVGLRARGQAGPVLNEGRYEAIIPDPYGKVGDVARNVWYRFVLHVHWSPNEDGFMKGWLNGKRFQYHTGPTLYSGISCYFKLANYHAPFGKASSILYDRVIQGATQTDVTTEVLD